MENSQDQVMSMQQIKKQNQLLQIQLQEMKINQQFLLKQLIIQTKIQTRLANRIERITQEMAYMYREERQLEFAKPMKLFFKMIQGYTADYLERILSFLTLEVDVSTPLQENYSPIQFPYY